MGREGIEPFGSHHTIISPDDLQSSVWNTTQYDNYVLFCGIGTIFVGLTAGGAIGGCSVGGAGVGTII